MDSDLALALSIQNDFDREWRELSLVPSGAGEDLPCTDEEPIIGSELEDLDPTPDLHQLFIKFDNRFFWGYLKACEVKWSPRMTLCAGVCSYRRREGLCSIRLSVPLLKLRPRKDLVETLLHEMIHAYLFVTDRNDNHDGHGPEFHKHMYRINKETGTKISVYHSFHDEVNLYKQHWWKCDGPCVNRRPFFGLVKRSMNRAPGRYDNWFAEHQRSCGGTYHKIKEPEGYGLKKKKDAKSKTNAKKIIEPSTHQDIRSLFSKQINNDKGPRKPFSGQNIVGFGGTSYASTSTKSDKWSNNEASSSKTSSLKKTNPATSSTNSQESDLNDYEMNGSKQVIVGICAMEKKSLSKPMKEILTRLEEFEYIKTLTFSEDVILNGSVEEWPLVDCLIAFHSKGFPLEKAIEYAKLRKPYIINNLEMQYDIQDRRSVYKTMEKEGIEIPRHAILNRDSDDPAQNTIVEYDDHVEVNGVTFNKPFVEKPVSAEDHNIFMYYPTSAGGGSQRLFRKIGSRSSVYSSESGVRKTGSYIYEDFMATDGTDVKVYTVGPDYAHAEARKSPALDGKVERDCEGKEVRYPVILSNKEKLIARKVCLAFKQTVCGFDLLRANGRSIVCDVNGFSFVKNSFKYYDDCAKILGNMILRELAPTLHIPWNIPFQLDDPPIVPTTVGKMMELRCVVGVIRHGDRTPKQKMKLEVRHPKFFDIFRRYSEGHKFARIKLKKPQQLQEILDIVRELLEQIDRGSSESELIQEKRSKLEQIKHVLEMYGHFSGINRKVQLKYQPKGRPRNSSSEDELPKEPSLLLILKWGGELTPIGRVQAEELGKVFRCMYPGGQGTQGLGLLRLHSTYRHDLKIYASDEGRVQMTAAAFAKGLLALEGELTPILVQMVKSANTNGLLDNECDSSRNNVSEKRSNASKSINIQRKLFHLFHYDRSANTRRRVKVKLHEMMQMSQDFTPEEEEKLNPCSQISVANALKLIRNPAKCCNHIYKLIQILNADIKIKRQKLTDAGAKTLSYPHLIIVFSVMELDNSLFFFLFCFRLELYHGETWELMARRWNKLEKDFWSKNELYDISKVPDIYDCIKYDIQHNRDILPSPEAEELYIYAKNMADVVIPQEYGMTRSEKLAIAQGICAPLLRKIRSDLQRNIEADSFEEECDTVNRLNPRYSSGVSSPGRHVRTRLYFTSESHIHSLLTVFSEGGLVDSQDEQWQRAMEYVSLVSEMNYMTQVVIMLYEDPTKDPSSDQRFHVELHFSPGVNCCIKKELPPGPGFRPHSRNNEHGNGGGSSLDRSRVPSRDESTENASSTPLSPVKCSVDCSSGDLNKFFCAIEQDASTEEEALFEVNYSSKATSEPRSIESNSSNVMNCSDEYSSSSSVCKKSVGKRSRSLEKKGSRPRSLDCECDNKTNSASSSYKGLNLKKKFSHKGSTTTKLFSTAVISGSSSAPNLKEMSPVPGSTIAVSATMPTIRPLETLHNALSLRQLDEFLGYITSANFKTPSTSPPLRSSFSSKSNLNSRPPPPPLRFMSPANSFTSFVSSADTSPAPIDFFSRIRILALQQEDNNDSV
ncbi:inositol hexakisphosphate and diphosphoinositol-pentakisphosphate kinase 2 isoform X10 [Lepeophtheirus salmonis]|uniref:inositol hexakisphosphate and diphosphoinositol-pentakisphosphate kinase 2 isoform X10 n=1 Tax=Lepeophtheirus salmonis TaxID=72036 RepID=UPI003AF33101